MMTHRNRQRLWTRPAGFAPLLARLALGISAGVVAPVAAEDGGWTSLSNVESGPVSRFQLPVQ